MVSVKPTALLRVQRPHETHAKFASLTTTPQGATLKVFPELEQKYGSMSVTDIESVVQDNIAGQASAYRAYIEALAYLEHTRKYKQSKGYAKATFDTYLKHRFNITPSRYYHARKIYCQFPDEADWLGVGFLFTVQQKCGVEAIEPVIEDLKAKASSKAGPISVADREAILDKYKKPAKKAADPASVWKAKYEAEVATRLMLEAENKELTEQVAKLKATLKKYDRLSRATKPYLEARA